MHGHVNKSVKATPACGSLIHSAKSMAVDCVSAAKIEPGMFAHNTSVIEWKPRMPGPVHLTISISFDASLKRRAGQATTL